ncbi:Plus-end-directed kinesin ATPase protein [Dioscorea alata]|uniref:Plus-end-directed kinesin ATPase protein n=1 Tax=Dioscorea alata TaxID=55571 RepID=A0ACB7WKY6_DIOAL|nr:Plus-end-directed kinesin ATPase protein [Dioscorea alata]
MESCEDSRGAGQQKECVKVAVNIRPLITSELLLGCADCVSIVPGEPQVQIGSHAFTFDHVYGSSGTPHSLIFQECIAPLVDALFHGYNATVLAYGQTGSGKTYTMGTNYSGEANCGGIIPQVMETIFKKIEAMKDTAEILLRVSFIEIFKEEVFDLLDPHLNASLRAEGPAGVKVAVAPRAPIQIRETTNGGITLAGVVEAEVRSKEEMASYLARGSLSRATGSTNMNSQSSRSHAIFTISLEQKKTSTCSSDVVNNDEFGDDILSSKLHLVDLAGSERAKRTGADGLRLKEGIHINRGLLALGNVISALGDEKKRKEGGHVPYRDSKLTRLLQDSLGGNSKTVMIACISPADSNAEETLNTLKYANRARNIQNKAVINRDPMAAQMQKMRNQLEQLQAEVLYCRGGGALEELQILRHKISLLEASNTELHQELKEHQITCERLKQQALDAQCEKDELILKIKAARSGKSWEEIDGANNSQYAQEMDLVKSYTVKIQELEAQLRKARSFTNSEQNGLMDGLAFGKDTFLPSLHVLASDDDDKNLDVSSEAEEDEKEREHCTLQDRLGQELQELDKRLEQKEAEMKQFSRNDTSILKQHYERKLLELEHEKKTLQKEIEDLRFNLANISNNSDDSAQKLKEEYLQKLNMLEAQVSELKKKQEAQSQLLRQKQKSDEAAKRLQEEIQRIKSQKVHLQHKIKQESEQFRAWKATREKEVLQLKKEGRRNEYEMHKLMALNQRQKMVLQRKTEEASMATKRLKELLEARKASSRSGSVNGPGIQALMQAIESELEVNLRVHEVRSEYERQMEERAAMAKEVAKLKEESELFKRKMLSDCPQTMSPSARNSRISALENMLATSSTNLVTMASQLSEAEERERVFSGRGRWNQVRSLAEAKNVMNHLFNLASSSRCQLRDREIQCREKDSIISDFKGKVFNLSSLVRQLEAEKLKLLQELNLQKLASKRSSQDAGGHLGTVLSSSTDDGQYYALRKASRTSQVFDRSRNNLDFFEDMDTSDSAQSDQYDSDFDMTDEDWVESEKKIGRKQSRTSRPGKKTFEDVHTSDNIKLEVLNEETESVIEKNSSPICCSCSKSSSCKTKKCECRADGNLCGASCGCIASKCSNRVANFIQKESDDKLHSELSGSGGSNSSSECLENEKCNELVSECALLLQNALAEKPNVVNEDSKQRKPLSDIGNTVTKPNGGKRRKNWRKTTIQLVPSNPIPTSAVATNEVPRRREENIPPLRLPRVMDTRALDTNPILGDRNSVKAEGSRATAKDTSNILQPKSPNRLRKASDEKENQIV